MSAVALAAIALRTVLASLLIEDQSLRPLMDCPTAFGNLLPFLRCFFVMIGILFCYTNIG